MKCDELRPYTIYEGDVGNYTEHVVYSKSEADKVIAELKEDYKEACDRLKTANLIKDEQLAAARHHKYKRCLAMARWCESMCYFMNERDEYIGLTEGEGLRWSMFDRWRVKWGKLAEKFKSNNEVNNA